MSDENIIASQAPKSWREFSRRLRAHNSLLLAHLDDFNNAILVTGCQRSGTTMLASIINRSSAIKRFSLDDDHEFMSALALAGQRLLVHSPSDRFCFQTTYLNENYFEYFKMKPDHKLVWMLRNPHSVVYSMCYNWGNNALVELFEGCGLSNMRSLERFRYNLLGQRGLTKLRMACYAYVGKVSQLKEMIERIPQSIFVVEYDELARNPSLLLPAIFEFLELPYQPGYAEITHSRSITKANGFSSKEEAIITKVCTPVYEQSLPFLSAY
ncbi:MAG: sulfotransferase [Pseudomonadota bacterium]|nr:sulfotransferase [Pseudomonadota bacterium]